MKLVDRWAALIESLSAQDHLFVEAHRKQIPDQLWIIKNASLTPVHITGASVSHKGFDKNPGRITKVIYAEGCRYIDGIDYRSDMIRVHYKYSYGFNISGAFPLGDLPSDMYLSEVECREAVIEKQAKLAERAKLIEAGGLVCAYCNAVRPASEMTMHTVRHYYTQRHLDKPRPYCKEKGCCGYHQMSLEG